MLSIFSIDDPGARRTWLDTYLMCFLFFRRRHEGFIGLQRQFGGGDDDAHLFAGAEAGLRDAWRGATRILSGH